MAYIESLGGVKKFGKNDPGYDENLKRTSAKVKEVIQSVQTPGGRVLQRVGQSYDSTDQEGSARGRGLPAGARQPGRTGGATTPGPEAAARAGGRLTRVTIGSRHMSDHFSGPRAIAGPAGDICDLYAFSSPERSGHLVLVLDVLPQAPLDSHFSEAIVMQVPAAASHHSGRRGSRGLPFRRRGPGAGLQLPISRLRGKAEPAWHQCRKAGA